MVGVCYRYVADWQLAEDLAQDAFLRAMANGGSYRALGSFGNWLRKIAVNEALMWLRTRPEMVAMEEELADTAADTLDGPETDSTTFTQEELLHLISRLPAKQRTVFNLYAVEHRSHKQIAETLGITVANSKVLLSRARDELQGMLTALTIKKSKTKNQ